MPSNTLPVPETPPVPSISNTSGLPMRQPRKFWSNDKEDMKERDREIARQYRSLRGPRRQFPTDQSRYPMGGYNYGAVQENEKRSGPEDQVSFYDLADPGNLNAFQDFGAIREGQLSGWNSDEPPHPQPPPWQRQDWPLGDWPMAKKYWNIGTDTYHQTGLLRLIHSPSKQMVQKFHDQYIPDEPAPIDNVAVKRFTQVVEKMVMEQLYRDRDNELWKRSHRRSL